MDTLQSLNYLPNSETNLNKKQSLIIGSKIKQVNSIVCLPGVTITENSSSTLIQI